MEVAFFGGRSAKLRCWLRGRQATRIAGPGIGREVELDVPKETLVFPKEIHWTPPVGPLKLFYLRSKVESVQFDGDDKDDGDFNIS